jgi:bifunctional enzyme CysN/CysC
MKQANRERGVVIWFTGLSGSGKTSVGAQIERLLIDQQRAAHLLDGDYLRHGLNADLGFSPEHRAESVRRTAAVAQILADAGLISVVSMVSPDRAARDGVRAAHEAANLRFIEVFVDTPLEVCESRDPKGLYAMARSGDIKDFTGVDAPYDRPESPDVHLRPSDGTPTEQAELVLRIAGLWG